ncbi:MAG: hypothetical protein GY794_17805 [bacterium]|nr:hypothetical protein [bacterium]
MRTRTVIAAGLLVVLMITGCMPKVVGFFSDDPVDRATFERQAVKRRGELEIRRATLTAELAAAEKLGDAVAIAEVNTEIAKHQAERKTYNELYGQGVEDFDRQNESNEQMFAALTAAGEYGATAVGIPAGISQLVLGAILAFAARAGWIKMRKNKPTTPPPATA